MSSSFPSFASFPEPEEDAPKRSQDKKQRRRREHERDKGRENTKARRPRSRSSSRERRSKRDNDRERRDTKRRRRKDNERRWRPEDDEQDKSRQDRGLLAEGRDPESKPGMHLWFSDFKGDPLNLTLGTLYKGDVPKFRRAEREFFPTFYLFTYLLRIIIDILSLLQESVSLASRLSTKSRARGVPMEWMLVDATESRCSEVDLSDPDSLIDEFC